MEKIETSTGLNKGQHDFLLDESGLYQFGKDFISWNVAESWKENRDELMDECRQKFGLFKRPNGFWLVEATGQKGTVCS